MTRDQLVQALRQALSAWPGVRLALLFGSHAHGHARPHSDIDIGFLPQGDWSLAQELDLQGRLSRTVDRPVDLVRLDTAPLPLAWEVVRAGIALAGEHSVIARYRAAIALEHADVAPLAERSALHYARRLAEQGSSE